MSHTALIHLAGIVVLGITAQWVAWRLRVPSIFMLLATGLLVGPGLNLLDPDRLLGGLLLPIVSLSVAVILFESALNLRMSELKEAGAVIRNLVTVGALVTWVIASAGGHYILGLGWGIASLFGAVLVVTGPTVTIPLLRHIRPVGRIGSVVKWEGIVNDPIGAMLAVLVFGSLNLGGAEGATAHFLMGLAETLLYGVGIGLVGTALIVLLLRPGFLPDYLHNHAALAVVLTAFVAANLLQGESGLFAVTAMGVALANQGRVSIRHLVEFKENLRVLLLATLFIVLGARLTRENLAQLDPVASLLFLILLVFVARPLAVAASTWRTNLTGREKLFLMWMAPRGVVAAAVSSVFALELEALGYAGAERLVPLTFLVVIGTVALYGLTASPVARRLGLGQPNPQGVLIAGAHSWAREIARVLKAEGIDVRLVDTNWTNVVSARMEGLSVHYGSIIAETTLQEIDLGGTGRLLALTSNDEANSLAALHFIEVFGRAEVYQLAPRSPRNRGTEQFSPRHLRGRILFDNGMTFDRLEERFRAGATLKRTTLTREFDLDAFRAHYGEKALPLFLVTDKGRVQIFSPDKPLVPKPGHRVISLVDPAASGPAEPIPRVTVREAEVMD